MRIQGSTDLLMGTLETPASPDETADTGLFARLLQEQPDNGDSLPALAPGKVDSTKVPASSTVVDVRADATTLIDTVDTTAALTQAKATLSATSPAALAASPANTKAVFSTHEFITQSNPLLADGAASTTSTQSTTSEVISKTSNTTNSTLISSAKAADSDQTSNVALQTATTTVLANAATDDDSDAEISTQLTGGLDQPAKMPVSVEPQAVVLASVNPATSQISVTRMLQTNATQLSTSNGAAKDQTTTREQTSPELAGKAAQKQKSARDMHAHGNRSTAKLTNKLTSDELSDSTSAAGSTGATADQQANPASTDGTSVLMSNAQAAASSADLATGPSAGLSSAASSAAPAAAQNADSQPVNNQSAAALPQTATDKAAELSPTLPTLADESSAPALISVNNTDPVPLRSMRLPHGGKALPSASNDRDASSQGVTLRTFKDLADAVPVLNANGSVDTNVLQASQNALAQTSLNTGASDAAIVQTSVNSGATTLPALTSGAATATTNTPQTTMPYVMNSALPMASSGWGEETIDHIRWLKDHDQTKAEINLHPAELGRMSISIDIKDGQASIQMTAASAEAKELLEKSLPQLRELLAQSGMSLGDSGVTQHKNGQQHLPSRFNPLWFDSDNAKPVEISSGRPAAFRSAGGSYRIDQYV